MRRINHVYDESDMFDQYDDDCFDDYNETDMQYANSSQDDHQPTSYAIGASTVARIAPRQQAKKGNKSKKKKKVPVEPQSLVKDTSNMNDLVFQISETFKGMSLHVIREFLKENDNDFDKTVKALGTSAKNSSSKNDRSSPTIVVKMGETGTNPTLKLNPIKEADDTHEGSAQALRIVWPQKEETENIDSSPVHAKEPKECHQVANQIVGLECNDEEETLSNKKHELNLVVVGHVDAGKSTLFGHLLYKLKYVSEREMHKFEKESREFGKASFAFAWVMDTEEVERQRGVTVDVGVKYFETANRTVTLLDAPGHRDFIPTMITGAAQGDAAVLVVPGNEDEFESSFTMNGQTKEHAVLVRYCGIRNLVVAVNKMDLFQWSQVRYDEVVAQVTTFLTEVSGYSNNNLIFVPVSGLNGDNIADPLPKGVADWYFGKTLVDTIDSLPPTKRPVGKPLRMVVVDMFKTMRLGRTTVSGKIEAGILRVGQTVIVSPTNYHAKVKAIVQHRGKDEVFKKQARAGETVDVGLTDIEESMIGAGSILCDMSKPTPVVQRFTAEITTLAGLIVPILNGAQFDLHIQSFSVPATVTKLVNIKQGNDKPAKINPRFIRKNETAIVEIFTLTPVSLERYDDYRPLSRVLLRQNGVTVAAGRCLDL